ncbi:hypothetical protein EKO27_g4650 [Xylaria grammica]|uniref:Heterokaryon incompatibility domain-containing protein n=1 Tax=Xylaria grammica TaxID=363999 RepID=A0A439D7T6_9PEZI|nr:hypothetical protein EKO27_g4650 [Xylaria grammica]
MPTRVIDLGEPGTGAQPKLLITNGQHGIYAALSYSWGEGVRHQVQLRTNTIDPLQLGIPVTSMTLAHQECLQIARKLGIRYVWIDAFGIIQNDKTDWANESVKIADVYGNAHLTIVAGRSDNSLDGFVKSTFQPKLPPASIPYSTLYGKTEDGALCYLSLPRTHRPGPVDTRAWCFQELMLSRRMVIYGDEQMGFNCRERSNWEDGAYDIPRWNSKEHYDMSSDMVLGDSLTKETVLNRWHEITMAYSLRYVYDPTDNFATMSGVALRFQRALGCRFLAGLWEDDMIRGLLWKSRRIWPPTRDYKPGPNRPLEKPLAVRGSLKGKPIVRAPSWSWLALLGPIIPAAQRRENLLLEDKSNIRCHPANADKRTWSPDAWDPKIVKYPFPQCRLVVLACVRDVRRSSMTSSQYLQNHTSKWGTLWGPARRELVPLEPITRVSSTGVSGGGKGPQGNHVVAMGLFDLTDGNPDELSIMCVLGFLGLMLQRQSDGNYARLGVFTAEDDAWCYDGRHERVVLI